MQANEILLFICLLALPMAITELFLFMWRRSFGFKAGYVWVSSIIRTITYSPCIGGAGGGAIPMLLGSAILAKLRGIDVEIVWFYGVPEVVVGVICFLSSSALRVQMFQPKHENAKSGESWHPNALMQGATPISLFQGVEGPIDPNDPDAKIKKRANDNDI